MAKKPTNKQNLIDAMAGVAVEVKASDGAISRIADLAEQQHKAAIRVAELMDDLKTANEHLEKLKTIDLPEAMREAGMEKFTTADGLEVEVKPDVKVGIPAPRREEAYNWLAEQGYGGLIKSDIDILFDREELKKAEKLADQLRKKGYEVSFNQSVHYQTLKAFVKERMADTESEIKFPLDLFGAFPYTVAVVKASKKRKLK
jgi:hypothetical protein